MSDELLKHVQQNPPRCLVGLRTELFEEPVKGQPHSVSFVLAAKDGSTHARIQGYSLGRLNPKYVGPPLFMSPISLLWTPSGKIDQLFDSKIHGYHAEIESTSANMRGNGPQDTWKCPSCDGGEFRVRVSFDYFGGADDLWEDEPELPIENYFNGIRIFGTCAGCSKVSQPVGMDL